MAKEAITRKKAIQILERKGWLVWHGPKVKYKQTDIFGTFDLICWKKRVGELKFIQLTTLPNLSTRRKKIKNFLKKNKINTKILPAVEIELWAWNKNNKKFKVELI